MLSVEELDVRYGSSQVLWSVSVSVGAHELVGILGPNGAGKSTLLNCVAGLVRPSAGRVLFDGRDITRLGPHDRVRAGMALVLERHRLFALMSVEENLLVGSYLREAKQFRKESLEWVLSLFPALAPKLKTRAQYLSGGEQQMAAIGRSLMTRPKLLMVDEPYLGLSPKVVDVVNQAFSELVKRGVAVLFIEQHVALTLQMVERVCVMSDGRVALDDSSRSDRLHERIHHVYFGGVAAKLQAN